MLKFPSVDVLILGSLYVAPEDALDDANSGTAVSSLPVDAVLLSLLMCNTQLINK